MKQFRYNGIGYTLYGRGEFPNSPHPCIADASGNCPYYSQRKIVGALLHANNIWPEPSENTHQYIARALQLPEDAVSEIRDRDASQADDDVVRFQKLLEWFVRQQQINGNIINGQHVAGKGSSGHKIQNCYAEWRDYGDFTLDVTLRCDFALGTKANYIHVTDGRVNIIADYIRPASDKCDVTALRICINARTEDEIILPSVSVQTLGLFSGQAPNGTLKQFFRDYVDEIHKARGTKQHTEEPQKEKPMKFPLNQILYGPPGTGKTYNTVCYALAIVEDKPVEELQRRMRENKDEVLEEYRQYIREGRIAFTTFHQSMGYEEFIEGIRPEADDAGNLRYAVKAGIFKKLCDGAKVLGGDAEAHYEYPDKYVFIIDEINRGNVSRIFGELITLIEESKRLGNAEETQCILPYSGEKFGVPQNVYLLGTMNTADRSLVQLDAALRRRFSFTEMMPDPDLIPVDEVEGVDVRRMLSAINERISALVDREHQIGHAYFMGLHADSSLEDLAEIFRDKLLPLLQEYFYDDYTAIRTVLSDAFITEKTVSLRADDSRTIYGIAIPDSAEAYRSIYEER